MVQWVALADGGSVSCAKTWLRFLLRRVTVVLQICFRLGHGIADLFFSLGCSSMEVCVTGCFSGVVALQTPLMGSRFRRGLQVAAAPSMVDVKVQWSMAALEMR